MNIKRLLLAFLLTFAICPLGHAEDKVVVDNNETNNVVLEKKSSNEVLKVVEEKVKEEVIPKYVYLPSHMDAFSYYSQAEQLYYEALNSTNREIRKRSLASAIGCISNSVAIQANSICSKALASSVYRAYGVDSYARSYYNKAIAACIDSWKNGQNITQAHIDLAVLYYAGDSRFYPNYEEYKQKAYTHANEFLRLSNENINKDEKDWANLASAYFVLGNEKKAKEYLKRYLSIASSDNNVYEAIIKDTFSVYPCNEKEKIKAFLLYTFIKGN